MYNGLDSDQDRHFVSPDLGPNCLQRLISKMTKGKSSSKKVAPYEEAFNVALTLSLAGIKQY